MNDWLCYGYHVWVDRGTYTECTRCGMTERTTETRSPQPTVAQLIDFAAAHPGRFNGRVDEAIRTDFGITPARYFQLLSRAIHTEQAIEHDPVTTHRLRRQASQQARTRAARTTP